ncbi:hypothetical protein J40TS1_18920 [Paenibacillus montaniterrae]|uniref:Uncharacterized protein n=1 Tax=Paenibacillus montaniterrae TaxID=429341 RepID=A0A920CXE8_9BACL|nr:hypothetical protein [Paenibacillus montaniterrae]GIP16250.1 hypothetical protein J40TS1_18920 [Paenibacillus montaniterrae]
MNRARYVPFERNRYFYGKLLTVRDFMSEQTYNSDKRRLVNRLLHGSGVAVGLQVVAVDDKSISIGTGVALDALGREIVVASPITAKLSNIDGFMNNDYAKNVYLCIAYDEKGKEPVHTVAGGVGGTEEVSENNRILETYRLYLTDQPPAPAYQELEQLMEERWVWYDDGQVRIYQQAPRYVSYGQVFQITLMIEKTLQTPPISFQYVPELDNVELIEGAIDGIIQFHEPSEGSESHYVKTITLKAASSDDADYQSIGLGVVSGSAKLTIGDRTIYDLSLLKQQIAVSEQPPIERIMDAYYSRSLDQALAAPSEPAIYIAQINMLQMGASYVIDRVIPQPFDDYIINASLLYKLLKKEALQWSSQKQLADEADGDEEADASSAISFPSIEEEFARLMPEPEEELEQPEVVTGVVDISIVPEKKKKWYHRKQRTFYSDEIEHGLPQDLPVLISLSISDEDILTDVPVPEMWKRSDAIVAGDITIFNRSEHALQYPRVSLAHIQYPRRGTFVIGLKLLQKTERLRLRVRWWAAKAAAQEAVSSAAEQLEESMQRAASARE